MAGTESVLPRWVHKRFPAASRFIRDTRGTPCDDPQCAYCSEHHNLEAKLGKYFGFRGFRSEPKTVEGESLQQRLVERGMEGRPLLGIMPTGGGKSLCYQLPAILRNERSGALTVVISPLQALMKDQVDNLNAKTVSPTLAATLNGLQTMPERRDVLQGVRLGRYALLYVSPEQLRNRSFKRAIRQREIASWVFDEAHCISKWGHDFRPDYLYAARFIREFSRDEGVEVAPVACFTATAKLDVQEEIVSHFRQELQQEIETISGDRLDRDNLCYSVEEVPASRKKARIHELLAERIGNPARGAAIIYASSRRGTEELAAQLRQQGWEAEHFHAGLDAPQKKQVQDAFISGHLPVIVATNAFGMGIDKEDVRVVVHADVPGSLENYLQEAGRAGRDGKPAPLRAALHQGRLGEAVRSGFPGSTDETGHRSDTQGNPARTPPGCRRDRGGARRAAPGAGHRHLLRCRGSDRRHQGEGRHLVARTGPLRAAKREPNTGLPRRAGGCRHRSRPGQDGRVEPVGEHAPPMDRGSAPPPDRRPSGWDRHRSDCVPGIVQTAVPSSACPVPRTMLRG